MTDVFRTLKWPTLHTFSEAKRNPDTAITFDSINATREGFETAYAEAVNWYQGDLRIKERNDLALDRTNQAAPPNHLLSLFRDNSIGFPTDVQKIIHAFHEAAMQVESNLPRGKEMNAILRDLLETRNDVIYQMLRNG